VDDVVWLTLPEYVPSAGGLFLDGRALGFLKRVASGVGVGLMAVGLVRQRLSI
jgi:hypothetical protein